MKDKKILMTEVMSLVLKPTKDSKMHQAYIDCFVSLTKHFCDSKNKQILKYVVFTYKELLAKYLGGRGAPAHCLNQQFFQRIFEETSLGQKLLMSLLNYILPSTSKADGLPEESVESAATQ